jgi:hypothetical protein
MDIGSVSGIASLATGMAQERLAEQVSIAVLKKALAVQAAGALALVQALPPPAMLPPHLGRNVDTVA